MSFYVNTFSIVSSEHMESIQQIIVAMGCYVHRARMRLHDVYKLNTNTERKGEGYGCLSVCPPADWLSDCLSISHSVGLPACLTICLPLSVCLSHSVSKNIYSGFARQYQIALYKLEVICLIFEVPFAVTIDLLNIWVVRLSTIELVRGSFTSMKFDYFAGFQAI